MYSLSVNDHVIEGLWPCGCRQNSLRSRKGAKSRDGDARLISQSLE